MFLGELVESIHGVTEGTSITDVFPSKRRQAGWEGENFLVSVCEFIPGEYKVWTYCRAE